MVRDREDGSGNMVVVVVVKDGGDMRSVIGEGWRKYEKWWW